MLNRFLSLPIRTHLVLLISSLAIPFIILIIYSGIVDRNDAIHDAKQESLRFVGLIASDQQSLVAGIEQLVTALSYLPELQSRNVKTTNAILADLLRKNPQYTNIAIMDKAGMVWGTAASFKGKVSLGDRKYVLDAKRTGKFSFGEYTIGRISGKPIINFGFPVKDKANQLIAIIGVALDLEYIQHHFKRMHLPTGSSYSVLDHKGVILYTYLEKVRGGNIIGSRDSREEMFARMKDGPDEGTFELVEQGNVHHLFAYKKMRLPGESQPYLYIRTSIPKDSAIAGAKAAMFKRLAILLLLFSVGLFLAWRIGKRVIIDPIGLLKRATGQIADGEGVVHASAVVMGGELGDLARAFDSMAESLIQREAAKKAAESALRESEGKFRGLAEKSFVGIYLLQDNLIRYANEMFADMFGYRLDEIIDKLGPEDLVIPEDLPLVAESIRRRIYGETESMHYEFRICKRGGEIRYVEAYSTRTMYQGRLAVIGTLLDITERKRAEEALRDHAREMQWLLKSMANAFVIWETVFDKTRRLVDIRFAYFNDAYEVASGLKLEDVKGKTIMEVWPGTEQSWLDVYGDVALTGNPRSFEMYHASTQGLYACTAYRPWDTPARICCVFEDITDRKRAENALQESEAKFRDLVEKTIVGVYLIQGGLFRYVNSRFAEIFGYEIDEIVDRLKPQDVILPEDVSLVMENIRRRLDGEMKSIHYEFRILTKSRETRHVEIYSSFTFYQGKPAVIGSLMDITDRKRIDEEMKVLSRKNENALQIARMGHWEFDLVTGMFMLNDQYFNLHNLLPGQTSGYRMSAEEFTCRYIHPDDARLMHECIQKAAATNDPDYQHQIELRILCSDGEVRYVAVRFRVELDADGRAITMYGVNQDITARKQAEEELKRLSTAIEQAAEEVMVTDPEGVIQYVNPAFERITGYSRAEALGRKPSMLKSNVHGEEFYTNLWDTIKSGNVWTGRMTNQRKDGQLIQEDTTISPLFGPGGQITGYVSLKRDVTEEVRLETQLFRAQKMEAVGTLAAGIAHDFNNILSGIQGHITLMQLDLAPDHPYHQRLQSVETHVMSGANLTRQLLGFARGGKYEVQPTDVNQLLDKIAEMFSRANKGIGITRRFQAGLLTVEADPGQIEQVMLNIFINAAQAMSDEGNIYLETREIVLRDADVKPHGIHAGRYVKISITDTGLGMDKDTLDRVFEPFFTTKSPGKGSGLGLASAYGIIKNHGGFITVYSEPGAGSTFSIYLPVSGAGIANEEKKTEAIQKGRETILVVDDEHFNVTLTKEILENLGYHVFTAGSGQEAVAVFMDKRKQIDLVILDMIMPGMGGRKTFNALRAVNPDVKILLASGYSINGEAQQLLNEGCNGFIQKPFRIQELSKKIRDVL